MICKHLSRLQTLSGVCLYTLATICAADSLGRAYELALVNDYLLREQEETFEANQELDNIGRAALLPNVSARYSYQDVEENADSRLLVLGDDNQLIEVDGVFDRTVDIQGWELTLSQPLFDGSAWYQYQQTKSLTDANEITFTGQQQALVLRVSEAYIDVLRIQDNLAAARAQQRAFERQLAQTKQRFDTGLIPVTDVTESQAAYDLATVTTLVEENNVETALETLNNLTGEEHTALNILRSDFIVKTPTPLDREKWVEAAIAGNFELQAARYMREAAESKRKASRWKHSPTLKAEVLVNNFNTSGDLESNLETPFILSPDQDLETRAIALRLEMPLYQGGSISANRRRAARQLNAAEERVQRIARDVTTKTRQLHMRVMSDIARVEARRLSILSAKSALDATTSGYEVGTRNIVDVLNAQNILFAAERDFANSRYDYILNSMRLRKETGQLSSGDLYRLDAFLIPPTQKQSMARTL